MIGIVLVSQVQKRFQRTQVVEQCWRIFKGIKVVLIRKVDLRLQVHFQNPDFCEATFFSKHQQPATEIAQGNLYVFCTPGFVIVDMATIMKIRQVTFGRSKACPRMIDMLKNEVINFWVAVKHVVGVYFSQRRKARNHCLQAFIHMAPCG